MRAIQVAALGFIEVTRKGSAGNAEHRQATMFLLTYRPSGSDVMTKNGWRRILSLKEAEAVALAAREGKADRRASEFGRRGAKSRWAKVEQYSSDGNRTDQKQNPSDGKRTEISDGNRTEAQ